MPSILIGSPLASGAQQLISGNAWSGRGQIPVGGIQLRLSPTASGNIYIGLSGGITLNSGGMFMSGGGLGDGVLMAPGDGYFVPRLGTGLSGGLQIYIRHDAVCSGQARLYYEIF